MTEKSRLAGLFKHFPFVTAFIGRFVHYVTRIRDVILTLVFMIALGGWAIAVLERIRLGNAVYFAFVTGLSIGYGDITPETIMGKIVAVAIGFVGILFVGITAAIATRALADTGDRFYKKNR